MLVRKIYRWIKIKPVATELLNHVPAALVSVLLQLSKDEKSDPLARYSALSPSCASQQALNFQTATNNEITKM
jgi:hypothetical protein